MTFNELLSRLHVPAHQEAASLESDGVAIYQLPEQQPSQLRLIEGIQPIPLDLEGYAAFYCAVEGGTARIVGMVSREQPTPMYTGCLAAFRPS